MCEVDYSFPKGYITQQATWDTSQEANQFSMGTILINGDVSIWLGKTPLLIPLPAQWASKSESPFRKQRGLITSRPK